jgi:hypothetical protein
VIALMGFYSSPSKIPCITKLQCFENILRQ